MVADAPPRRTGVSSSTPPPRTASPPPSSGKRIDAVKELLAIPMIPLGILATADSVRSPDPEAVSPYAMDMVAIGMHTEAIAESVAALGDAYPVLGAVLDRIGSTTPFIALIGVGMALGMQIMENHNSLPEGMRSAAPGLVSREDLAKQIRDESRARQNGHHSPTES